MTRNRTRRLIFAFVCISILTIPAVYYFGVDAETSISFNSQQDRTITPAGKLIVDASNGLIAIAPLTMGAPPGPVQAGSQASPDSRRARKRALERRSGGLGTANPNRERDFGTLPGLIESR